MLKSKSNGVFKVSSMKKAEKLTMAGSMTVHNGFTLNEVVTHKTELKDGEYHLVALAKSKRELHFVEVVLPTGEKGTLIY